jgi:fatty-acyl-CoA synthase
MTTTDSPAGAAPAHYPPDRGVPLIEGSVGDALRRTVARFPDRRALVWPEGEGVAGMSYAELLAEAERIAWWLLSRGAPGDRVAIWSRNSLEWVLAEYGCALAGMVIASWNPGWTDYECEHARDLTTPVIALVGSDTRGVPLLDRARAFAGDIVVPLDDLRRLSADAVQVPLPKVASEDLFLIQFTSGTTGKAKGAALSNRAALNSANMRVLALGADETDVWVNPSPMNHMGGAISVVPGAMLVGACYTIVARFEAGEFLRLMKLCNATRIGGVPTMLLGLLEHPDWVPGSVRLRSIGAGGASVPQTLIERMTREFGCQLLNVYAQSESPMVTHSVIGDDARLLSETVGRPVPHIELEIRDPRSRRVLALGEIGEVCVRTPSNMDGYYRNPEATAATIGPDGFLRTGDLGSLDADGYLRINGRSREVIIRGGENIYPAEVEEVLLQHPDIVSVAVVGVADARWGQQVGAAVLLRDGQATREALEAHAATRLAHFKVPKHWMFVDSFPLTPSGKIRKVDVEAMFREPTV